MCLVQQVRRRALGRHADRLLLFLNAVLLMDIAFIPFAASVLANAFREGQGERTAVLLHGPL